MGYKNIAIEREGNIAILILNRPQMLNAMNRATMEEFSAAIDELAADDGVRAIILTGAGERAFIAGADIKWLRDLKSAEEGVEFSQLGQVLISKIIDLPKPVIAAINGYALGGGCEVATACDIRIAAEGAKLGVPEIDLGIFPGYGGTQRLPRLVGKGMASYLILSGEMITAEEAKRIGLVDFVVPADALMKTAKELANKLAAKPPIAMSLAKRAINAGLEGNLALGLAYEAALFGLACATEDRIEGTSAFLEKRKPEFKGK